MNTFKAHMEILPPKQLRLWPKLAAIKNAGFVLYGGTAVALQIGHRSSVDFDFFSTRFFNLSDVMGEIPWLTSGIVQSTGENTVELVCEDVKISLFGSIQFGRIGQPLLTDDGVIEVASLDDLLALKLATITQRASYKDYCDICAMIEQKISFENALAGAQSFYGNTFSVHTCLSALSYFGDGDLYKLSECEKKILIGLSTFCGKIHERHPVSFSLSETAQQEEISFPVTPTKGKGVKI
jgi:hypothetical protein